MNVTLFNDNWYHGIISQTLDKHGDASADSRLLAEAVLTGLCCIAQSIDHAADANSSDSLAGAIGTAGSEIAEALQADDL